MSDTCRELHIFVNGLPRHRFPLDSKSLPQNGIYVLFEKGEIAHGADRIVRVGTSYRTKPVAFQVGTTLHEREQRQEHLPKKHWTSPVKPGSRHVSRTVGP